jgi:hypothetical protein
MVIHLVGDIHQPLHTVSVIDSTYVSGDHGGNNEKFPPICGVSTLHGVWDSIAYNYCGYPTLPLSSSDWEEYGINTASMAIDYPSYDEDCNNFEQWALESYQLATSVVYPGKFFVLSNKVLARLIELLTLINLGITAD